MTNEEGAGRLSMATFAVTMNRVTDSNEGPVGHRPAGTPRAHTAERKSRVQHELACNQDEDYLPALPA